MKRFKLIINENFNEIKKELLNEKNSLILVTDFLDLFNLKNILEDNKKLDILTFNNFIKKLYNFEFENNKKIVYELTNLLLLKDLFENNNLESVEIKSELSQLLLDFYENLNLVENLLLKEENLDLIFFSNDKVKKDIINMRNLLKKKKNEKEIINIIDLKTKFLDKEISLNFLKKYKKIIIVNYNKFSFKELEIINNFISILINKTDLELKVYTDVNFFHSQHKLQENMFFIKLLKLFSSKKLISESKIIFYDFNLNDLYHNEKVLLDKIYNKFKVNKFLEKLENKNLNVEKRDINNFLKKDKINLIPLQKNKLYNFLTKKISKGYNKKYLLITIKEDIFSNLKNEIDEQYKFFSLDYENFLEDENINFIISFLKCLFFCDVISKEFFYILFYLKVDDIYMKLFKSKYKNNVINDNSNEIDILESLKKSYLIFKTNEGLNKDENLENFLNLLIKLKDKNFTKKDLNDIIGEIEKTFIIKFLESESEFKKVKYNFFKKLLLKLLEIFFEYNKENFNKEVILDFFNFIDILKNYNKLNIQILDMFEDNKKIEILENLNYLIKESDVFLVNTKSKNYYNLLDETKNLEIFILDFMNGFSDFRKGNFYSSQFNEDEDLFEKNFLVTLIQYFKDAEEINFLVDKETVNKYNFRSKIKNELYTNLNFNIINLKDEDFDKQKEDDNIVINNLLRFTNEKREKSKGLLKPFFKNFKETPYNNFYSISQINTYKDCPLKYFLKYGLGIPEKPKHYFYFGSLIHEILENFLRKYNEMKKLTDEEIYEILLKELTEKWKSKEFVTKQQSNEYFEVGKNILKKFIQRNKKILNNNKKIYDLEIKKEITFNNKKIYGIIDRVDLENEVYHIIDYKTSKSKKKYEEILSDLQLNTYALLLKHITGKYPETLTLWYLINDELVTINFKEETLKEVMKEIMKVIKDIEELKFSKTKDKWKCNYCEFKEICNLYDKL